MRAYLSEENPCAMLADGLESALVGIVQRFGMDPIALYDYDKCIATFMSDGATFEEAQEHFDFNVLGAWVGDGTPAFMVRARVLSEPYINTLRACEAKLELRGEDDGGQQFEA